MSEKRRAEQERKEEEAKSLAEARKLQRIEWVSQRVPRARCELICWHLYCICIVFVFELYVDVTFVCPYR